MTLPNQIYARNPPQGNHYLLNHSYFLLLILPPIYVTSNNKCLPFSFVQIVYKMDHTVCIYWLAFFTQHHHFWDSSMLLCVALVHSFLLLYTVVLDILGGLVPGPPSDTKIHRCSSPLYKMAQYLHKAYTRPSAYFKSPLDYL